MPLDSTLLTPSNDLMIDEISRLENEVFFAEKKLRDITTLLGHARTLMAYDFEDYEDAVETMEDIDQMLAVSMAISKADPNKSKAKSST